MKNDLDLYAIATKIADALNEGLAISFRNNQGEQEVVVMNPASGFEISATVNHPRLICPRDYRLAYGTPAVKKAAKPIAGKKKSAKWWSRFNFEKNIMKMTLLALQDRYPAQVSFTQAMFAEKLARMMDWQTSTAKRHITQAAKLGILNRAIIGTAYHITGINDEPQETLKQDKPEEMPLPFADLDEMQGHAPCSALAEEGRPLLERELEKAVDETILP